MHRNLFDINVKTTKRSTLPNKPWNAKPKVPNFYFWKSSLPDRMLLEHGENYFKHISQSTRNKNTIDFLKNSQKYMEIIADSHRHTPSMRVSKAQSHTTSPRDSNRSVEIQEKQYNQLQTEVDAYIIPNKICRSQSQVEINSSEGFKIANKLDYKSRQTGSISKFEPKFPNEVECRYIINGCLAPRLLACAKKLENKKPSFKNNQVNEFINRFDKKDRLMPINKIRLGVNGWKLKRSK